MRKKILFIILAFFSLGCEPELQAEETAPMPVITPPAEKIAQEINKPDEDTVETKLPVQLAKALPTQSKEVKFETTPAEAAEAPDEDEQLKQILIEKAKKAYEEHRENIKSFLCRIVIYVFAIILFLNFLVKMLNKYLSYPFGFLIVMIALATLAIVSINVYL